MEENTATPSNCCSAIPEEQEKKMERFRAVQTCSILFLLISVAVVSAHKKSMKPAQPCKRIVLYYHDILFNGTDIANATSRTMTNVSMSSDRFGLLNVFDGPMTKDNHLMSPPVARAQGFYIYDTKHLGNALFSYTLLFNSSEYKGTLNLMGADLLFEKSRDISVVGGTGDFFMTRGICTFETDAIQGLYYFRVKMDIKLYECY